jgi:O-antigen ligase
VISVLQLFAGNGKIYWMFHTEEHADLGPFMNPDHYASFVALVIPMTAFEMVQHPRRRWFFAVATAALYASVVAGASRAGFVLVTLELVVMFVIVGFRHRTVPGVAALLVAFVLVVGWQSLYSRLRAPDPYRGRREVAEATTKMIRANPWKGYGLGTWTEVYPAFAQKDFGVFVNAAHSDWLQWWAEGGVPVLGCLAVVFISAILIAPRLPWAMGVPIVFLHSLVDFPLQGRFLPAMLFLVLGVAARRVRRSRSAPLESSASPA